MGSSQLGPNMNLLSACNRALMNLTASVSTTEAHLKYYFVAVLIEPQVLHELVSEQITSIIQGSGSTVQLRSIKHEHPGKQIFHVQTNCYLFTVQVSIRSKSLPVLLKKFIK